MRYGAPPSNPTSVEPAGVSNRSGFASGLGAFCARTPANAPARHKTTTRCRRCGPELIGKFSETASSYRGKRFLHVARDHAFQPRNCNGQHITCQMGTRFLSGRFSPLSVTLITEVTTLLCTPLAATF